MRRRSNRVMERRRESEKERTDGHRVIDDEKRQTSSDTLQMRSDRVGDDQCARSVRKVWRKGGEVASTTYLGNRWDATERTRTKYDEDLSREDHRPERLIRRCQAH